MLDRALPEMFDFGSVITPRASGALAPGKYVLTVQEVSVVALKSSNGWGLSLRLSHENGGLAYIRISLSSEKTPMLLGALASKLGEFSGKATPAEFGRDLLGRSGEFTLKANKQSVWADVQLF